MKLLNYIGMVVILTTMGILFKRYQQKYELDPELTGNDLVKRFLLNEEMIYGKPSLWIHVNKEINSRNWESFCARSSLKKNKPYIQVCIESLIKYNGDNFNVFLIDDESFGKLMDDWDIVLSNVPSPMKEKVRKLGLCKLLYKFGGMVVPSSFLATCNLIKFYNQGITENKMFCAENVNKSSTQLEDEFLPDCKIMGCTKFNDKMGELCSYMMKVMEDDGTDESKFLGLDKQWLKKEANEYGINVINGRLIGLKDIYDKYITLEDLMGESIISFDENKSGIYVEEEELERRTKYGWFNRLSKEQLFRSNTILGEQMLLSHGN